MRLIPLAIGAVVVATLAIAQFGTAQDTDKPADTAEPADTASGDAAQAEYVGDAACKKCHFKEHRSWKKTPMANAMKTLRPTTEADDKALFDKKKAGKMDPAKDYTTDAKCLQCHTTGYGKPGGYPVDATKDDAAKEAAERMGSVSCEACHGPGSLYVAHKTAEVEKDKDAKFTFEQMGKYGLTHPDEANCAQCHNDQAPNVPAEAFNFDEAKEKVHSHPKK